MRKFIFASLISGATAWSAGGLLADPPSTDAEDAPAIAEESDVGAPRERDRRRDGDRPRRGPDGDRPEGRRGGPRAADDAFNRRDRGPRDGGPRDRGPDGERGGRRFAQDGRRGGGPMRDMLPPLLRALDADGDREISADEIANATAALKTLDADENGKLTLDELRPQFAGRGPRDGEFGRPGEGRRERFRDGFGRGDEAGPRPDRREFGRRGDGPPREGEGGDREFRKPRGPRGEFDDGERPRRGRPRGERKEGDRPRPPRGGPDADRPPEGDPQADDAADTKV